MSHDQGQAGVEGQEGAQGVPGVAPCLAQGLWGRPAAQEVQQDGAATQERAQAPPHRFQEAPVHLAKGKPLLKGTFRKKLYRRYHPCGVCARN